jgi:predicted RNA binding protein YcfA (HicA-like mRNA interferase family)/predicted RNase H-like HicB family nuclease
MSLDDYKVVLYRNQPGGWVAEVPSIPGCHALMPTREAALAELAAVFQMIRKSTRSEIKRFPPTLARSCMPSGRAEEFRHVATELGFRKTRQTGSHERWQHPDGRATTIPAHGGQEIGPPLFYSHPGSARR